VGEAETTEDQEEESIQASSSVILEALWLNILQVHRPWESKSTVQKASFHKRKLLGLQEV